MLNEETTASEADQDVMTSQNTDVDEKDQDGEIEVSSIRSRQTRNSSSFIYENVPGGVKIIEWDGVFNDPETKTLIIPDTYLDPATQTEVPVVAIGMMYFMQTNQKFTIGANIKTIGDNVFSLTKLRRNFCHLRRRRKRISYHWQFCIPK